MDSIDTAILNALRVNMGYKDGERVGIVKQLPGKPIVDVSTLSRFTDSEELCDTMFDVFNEAGIPAELLTYYVNEARNGADATRELYAQFERQFDVLFLPTAYSLSHTPFRNARTAQGTRIASMPTFTIAMFADGGPMSADYEKIQQKTREIADKLRASDYALIEGPGTHLFVQIDRSLVHESTGMMTQRGQWGNLPGAEAYCVPVYKGDSYGVLTVPAGWGGDEALPFDTRFIVDQGRFTRVEPVKSTPGRITYLRDFVSPILFGGDDFNVLAELGIGTNYRITPESIKRDGWSVLTGEKIWGTAHVANGNSKGMGGTNNVPVHVDWVVPASITYEFQP